MKNDLINIVLNEIKEVGDPAIKFCKNIELQMLNEKNGIWKNLDAEPMNSKLWTINPRGSCQNSALVLEDRFGIPQ